MMSTLSILVFLLVQGHVVCDSEVFPVSIFDVDSVELQQIDSQENDEIEPLQGRSATERLEDPKVTTDDITWMDEIIKNYGFKKHPVADMWTEQPSFEGRLGTENFKTAAEKAEQFFLAKALLYAAQAYHTRGAIRHVVQGLQMKAIPTCQYYTPLSTYDLWVSMIENWGEVNKEYKHCRNISVAKCLMKMSKYLSRMFDAMRVIRRSRLPKKDREGLLDFGTTDDPEFVTHLLLRYRKSGKELSPAANQFVMLFWKKFNCNIFNPHLSYFWWDCLKKIHNEVNAYNKKLAANVNEIEGMELFEPPPNNF